MAEYRWSKVEDRIKKRINDRYNSTGFHLGSVKDEIYNRLQGDDPTVDIGMNAVIGAKDKVATVREYTLGNLERAVHGIDLEKTEKLLLHGRAKDIVKEGAKGVALRSGKFALHTGVSKFEGSLDSMKGDGVEDVGIGSFAAANDKRRTGRDAIVITRKSAEGAKFSYNYVKARHELKQAEVAEKSTPVPERPKGSRSRKGLSRKNVEARRHMREMRPHRRAVNNTRKARLRVKALNNEVYGFFRGYSPYHNLKDTAEQSYRVGRLGKDFLFRVAGIKTTGTGVGTTSTEGAFSAGTASQGESLGLSTTGTTQTTDVGSSAVKGVSDFVGNGLKGAMGSGGSGINPMSEMSSTLRDVGKGMLAEGKDMVSTSSGSSIGSSGADRIRSRIGNGGRARSRISNASNRIRTRASGAVEKASKTSSKAAGRAWQVMQRTGQGITRLITRLGMKIITGVGRLLLNPYVLLAVVIIVLLIFLLLILISTSPTEMSAAMILTDEEVFLDYRDKVRELDQKFQKELEDQIERLESKTMSGCRRNNIPYYNEGVFLEFTDVATSGGIKTDWQAVMALSTVVNEQTLTFSAAEEELILQLHDEMHDMETEFETLPCPSEGDCMGYWKSYSCKCKPEKGCSTCHRYIRCCPGHHKATIFVDIHTLDGVIPEKDERIIDKYLVTGSQWEFKWWKQLATYDIEDQYPGVRTKIRDTGLRPEGLPDDWPDEWGYPPSWPPPNGWKPAGWPLNLPFTWIHYQNFL